MPLSTDRLHAFASMTFAEYVALDAVNISSLLAMLVSPKEYRWRRTHPRKDTPAYRAGRAAHTAVLEPMRFLLDYALSPFPDFRKKAAQEWRDEQVAAGKTVLTQAQYQTAERIRDAIRRHPVARQHVQEGEPEATIRWTHERTGVECKGRIDLLNGAVVDLKTTRHPTPGAFGRDAARLHYHTRMSWYFDGVRAALGAELPVVLIAVQNIEPHDVAVYTLSEEVLGAGRRVYEDLLDSLRHCLNMGSWPGICESEALPLALPIWALGSEAEADNDLLDLDLEVTNDTEEADRLG